MDTITIHQQAEHAIVALCTKDSRFFDIFLHDAFLYINTQGHNFTKQQYINNFVLSDNMRFIAQQLYPFNIEENYPLTSAEYLVHDHYISAGEEYHTTSQSRRIYHKHSDGTFQWLFGHTFPQSNIAWEIPHLIGTTVELCPLSYNDIDGLLHATDDSLWQWTLHGLYTRQDMENYVRSALRDHASGSAIPFVIKDRQTGDYIGSTRFGCIDRENNNAEIGWTWIKPSHQKSSVNTEIKYAMLEYAFEHLQFHRISIITDSRNTRSQKAIERIGAKKEGIIRSHLITHNNYIRDSISYSIIREEWETIKNHFHHKLFRENSSTPSISAGSITK